MRAARRPWLLSLLALAGLGVGPPSAGDPPLDWRRALHLPGLGRSTAVAFDPASGRFVVGDERGVHELAPERAPRRVLRSPPVRDLLFAGRGVLYVATARGLFHLDAGGRATELAVGSGQASRDVMRLARAGSRLFAATADGVWASDDARHWRAVLREASVGALAARNGEGAVELWMLGEGRLRRAELGAGRVAEAALRVVDVDLPDLAARRGVDVAVELPEATVAVLGTERIFARGADGAWRALRPGLPPGAVPQRIGHAAGRYWLSTDRGLLLAPRLAGPWRRAPSPLGSAWLVAVAGSGRHLLAAGPGGLFEAHPRRPPAAGAAATRRPLAPSHPPEPAVQEPPVTEVHRAALRYLELQPDVVRALREGVRRRGWLPSVDLHGGYGEDRHRGREVDEVFTSGALRTLYDVDRDRDRDWEVGLRLAWDLGDTRYHPEAVDVSREAREVIELRDDVLDEITQLYYERRRALAAWAAAAPGERGGHALRADELAAGLDAWTGGWFGRRVPALATPPPPGPGSENSP